MSNSGIYYLIYSRQWKTIRWTSVIQVGVMNTD